MSNIPLLREALRAGEGIVRLAPCWVPRSFLMPGGRLKLDPRDLYALGAHRGGIDERWFASTTQAANGPGTPEDEGLSYIAIGEKRVLLKEAIEEIGDEFLGSDVMAEQGGWNVLCKFFDNLGPIPHHMHQTEEFAARVGQKGKPEAYYFPPQYNFKTNNFPYTFMGLEPGTTKDDVRRCLERWNEGDNGILDHSRAYRLKPGTGWQIDAGILHAPGSLVTYEPQVNSDVFGMFQSMVEGRAVPWDLLVKDVPPEHHHDLDYIISMLDWEANVDPEFAKHRLFHPLPVRPEEEMNAECYSEKWVVYSTKYYSAKELTVFPNATVTIRDAAAYGLILTQGYGTIGNLEVETPSLIRYGQMTSDELFVTAEAAKAGVRITNRSATEPLVMLKHFGPGNPDAAHLVRQ
jgi:Phosphomannose isomerase